MLDSLGYAQPGLADRLPSLLLSLSQLPGSVALCSTYLPGSPLPLDSPTTPGTTVFHRSETRSSWLPPIPYISLVLYVICRKPTKIIFSETNSCFRKGEDYFYFGGQCFPKSVSHCSSALSSLHQIHPPTHPVQPSSLDMLPMQHLSLFAFG